MIKESIATSVANFIIYGANWEWVHYSSFVFCLVFEVSLFLDKNLIFYEGRDIGIKKEGNPLSNSPLGYEGYFFVLTDSIANIPRVVRGFSPYVHLLITVCIAIGSLFQVMWLLPSKSLAAKLEKEKKSFYYSTSMIFFYSDFWLLFVAQQFLDTLSCKDYLIWLPDYRSALASTVLEAWRRPVGLTGTYEMTYAAQLSHQVQCYSVAHGYLVTVAVTSFCLALVSKGFEHFYTSWLPRYSCFLSKSGLSDIAHQVIIFTIMCIRVFMISMDTTSVAYRTLYCGICSVLLFLDLMACLMKPAFLCKKRNRLRVLEILVLMAASLLPFLSSDLLHDLASRSTGSPLSQTRASSYQPMKDLLYKCSALGIAYAFIYKLSSRMVGRQRGYRSRNQAISSPIPREQKMRVKFENPAEAKRNTAKVDHPHRRRIPQTKRSLLHTRLDPEDTVHFITVLLQYAVSVLGSKDIFKLNSGLALAVLNFKVSFYDCLQNKARLSDLLTTLHQQLVNFDLKPDSLKTPSVDKGLTHVPRFADHLGALNLPQDYPLEPVLELVDELFHQSIQDNSSSRFGLAKAPPLLARYFIYYNCEFRGKISNSIYHLESLKFSHLDENQRLELVSQNEASNSFLRLAAEPSDDIAHINLDYLILKKLVLYAGENNLETGNTLFFHKPNVLEEFKVFAPVYRLDKCVTNINLTSSLSKKIKAVFNTRKDLMERAADSQFESRSIMAASRKVSCKIQEIRQLFEKLAENSAAFMTSTRLLQILFQIHIELNLKKASRYLVDLKRSVYRHETDLVQELQVPKRVFEFGFDTSKRNYQKIVAYLSAESETFHKIIYATANIEKTLGFMVEEVLGADLDAILPAPIRTFHKKVCHPRTANSVFFAPGTEFNFFVRDKNQAILPCLSWVRISPNLDNGLALVGLLSVQTETDQIEDAVRRVILGPNHTVVEMCQAAKHWFDYNVDITQHCQLLGNAFEIYERVVEFRYQHKFEKIEDLFGTTFCLSDYEDYCALSEGVIFQLVVKDSTCKSVCVRIKHVKIRNTDQLVLVPEFIECSDKSRFKSGQDLHFVQQMLHSVQFDVFDTQLYDWQEGSSQHPETCVGSLVALMHRVRNWQDEDQNTFTFQHLNMVSHLVDNFIRELVKILPAEKLRLLQETADAGVEIPGFDSIQFLEQKFRNSSKLTLISSIMRQVNPHFDEAFESALTEALKNFLQLATETELTAGFQSPKQFRPEADHQNFGHIRFAVSGETVPTTSILMDGTKRLQQNKGMSKFESYCPASRSLIPRGSDTFESSATFCPSLGMEFYNNQAKQLQKPMQQTTFHNDSPKEHYVIDQLSDKGSKRKGAALIARSNVRTARTNPNKDLPEREDKLLQIEHKGRPSVSIEEPCADSPATHDADHHKTFFPDLRQGPTVPARYVEGKDLLKSGGQKIILTKSSEEAVLHSQSLNVRFAFATSYDLTKEVHLESNHSLVGFRNPGNTSQGTGNVEGQPQQSSNHLENAARLKPNLCISSQRDTEELDTPVVWLASSAPTGLMSTFLPVAAPPSSPDDLRMRVTFGSVMHEGRVQAKDSLDENQSQLVVKRHLATSPKRKKQKLPYQGMKESAEASEARWEEGFAKRFGQVDGDQGLVQADALQRRARILFGLVHRRKQWAFMRLCNRAVTLQQLVEADRINKENSNEAKHLKQKKVSKLSSILNAEALGSKYPSSREDQDSCVDSLCKSQNMQIQNVVGSAQAEDFSSEFFGGEGTFEKNYSAFTNLPLKTFGLCRYLCIVVFITNFSFILLLLLGLLKTTVQQSNYLFLKDNAVLMDEFTWCYYEVGTKSLLMELTMAVKSGALPEGLFQDYFQTKLLDDVLIYEVLLPPFIYARTSATSPFKLKEAVYNSSIAGEDNLDSFEPWESDKLLYQPSNYAELSPTPVKFTPPRSKFGTMTELVMHWVDYIHHYERTMANFKFSDYAQVNNECLWLHLVRLNGVDRITEENVKYFDLGVSFLRHKAQRVVDAFTYLIIPEEILGLMVLAAIATLFVKVYKHFTASLEILFRFSGAALEAEKRQLAEWVKIVDLMVAEDKVLHTDLSGIFPASALGAYSLKEQSSQEFAGRDDARRHSVLVTRSQPNTHFSAKSQGSKVPRKQIVSGWNHLVTEQQESVAFKKYISKKQPESFKRQKGKIQKHSSVLFNSRCFGLVGTLTIPLIIYMIFGVILIIPNMQNLEHAKLIQNRLEVSLLIVEVCGKFLLTPVSLWYAVVFNDTFKIGAQNPADFFVKITREIQESSQKLALYKDKDLGNMTETFRYFTTEFKMCENYKLGERAFFYMLKFANCTSTPAAIYNEDFLTYFKLTTSMMEEVYRSYLKESDDRGIEVFKNAMKDTSFSLFFTSTTFLFSNLGFYSLMPDLTSSIKESITTKTPSSGMLKDALLAYLETYMVLYSLAALVVTWCLSTKVQIILEEFLMSYKLISFRLMHDNPGLTHFVRREMQNIALATN